MKRRLLAVSLVVAAMAVVIGPSARAADDLDGTVRPGENGGTTATTGTGQGQTGSGDGLKVKDENGLAAGGGHALGITDGNDLWAWGYNTKGQLGLGRVSDVVPEPTNVTDLTDVSAAAGGEFHTLALKGDGSVWAFGDNADGQLGNGEEGTVEASPVEVKLPVDAVAVEADGNRSYARRDTDDNVWAWGANSSGQLGNGTQVDSTTPVKVDITGVSAIAAGGEHTLALKDGNVYAWGRNGFGELGIGESCNSDTGKEETCRRLRPVKVEGIDRPVIQIAAGQLGEYSLALLDNGTVMSWGRNDQGQLGHGSMVTDGCKCDPEPKAVKGLSGVAQISASGGAGIARKEDGTVWAWGNNTFGQLGNGQGGDSGTARAVEGVAGITTIATGGGFVLARQKDGTAIGWGINTFGELGVGNKESQFRPVPIGVPIEATDASVFDSSNTLLILLAVGLLVIIVVLLRRRRPPVVTGPSGQTGWGHPASTVFAPLAASAPSGADPPDLDAAWQEYGRRIRMLSRVDLFASASHDVLGQLAMTLRPLTAIAGDVVCREGDVGEEFFLVETGTLAITTEHGGHPRELARLGPGEFFGESALLGEGQRTATVQAVTDTELWAMSASEFSDLLQRRPEVDEVLRRTATQRSRTDRAFEVEEHDLGDLAAGGPGLRIGRAPDSDIVFDAPLVSGQHAVIEPRGGGNYRIRDLGSLNGTYVNRVRVRVAELHDGDEIWIADQHFVFDRRAIRRLVEPEGIRLDAIGLTTELKDGKRLLDNIDLSVLPGEFVAIVGGSGAGKTTLLQALSGVRPPTTGQVLYSGRDYYSNLDWFRSQLGYVPQDDIIHTTLPLGVTMRYSAQLRLPSDTSPEQLDAAMEQALDELGLSDHIDTAVGDLSGGQRKRCSIGVELLTQPRIFLLDEPTSGLDPYTDGQMMSLLRGLADKGSTVMLTTHATKNVMLCDKVVFLARGGQLAFVGTPHRALRYFEADAFDEIYRRLVEESTPEEWGTRFRASDDYRQLVSDQLRLDPAEVEAQASAGEVRAPGGFRRFRHQFPILSRRNRDLYVKNPKTLPSLIMPPVLFTLLALTLFKGNVFTGTSNSAAALQILFLIAFSAFIFGLLFGVQSIVSEFPVFQRERMVNLGILPYVLSKLAFLAPVLTVMLVLMIAVLRLTGRLPDAGLDVYWQLMLTIALTGIVGISLALLTSALVSNSQQATDMLSVWIMPQVLFAGALLAVPAMNFIGRMISAICPVRWSFEALGNIGDLETQFTTDTSRIGPGLAIQYAGSFTRNPVENWVILGLFIVVPLALTCLVLDRKTTTRRRPGPPVIASPAGEADSSLTAAGVY